MDLAIMYIGLSQSVLGALLIVLKRPLKIADIIIAGLLLNFAVVFGFDILQMYGILPENQFMLSICLFMLFPPLLFLYSKYVTNDYKKFESRDFLHALPPTIFIALALLFRLNRTFTPEESMAYQWLINTAAISFQLMLFIYSYAALRLVIVFKRKLANFYSFDSSKINLNWLIFVIIAFVLTFASIIVGSALFEVQQYNFDIDIFRHVFELFYVYILSVWGFRQIQLDTEEETKKTS